MTSAARPDLPEPRRTSRTRKGNPALATCLRLVASAAIGLSVVPLAFLSKTGASYWMPQVILASAATVLGASLFITHGGRHITAAGIYSLSLTTFVGMPGLYIAFAEKESLGPGLLSATALVYASHILMYSLFWARRLTRSSGTPTTSFSVGPTVAVGASLLLAGSMLERSALDTGPIAAAIAFDGALIAAIALLVRPAKTLKGEKARLNPGKLIGIFVFVAAYFLTIFTGSGRLTLTALAAAILIAGGRLLPQLRVKVILLLMLAPALLAFGILRVERVETLTKGEYTPEAGGLGSVIAPLTVLGTLMERASADDVGADRLKGTFGAAIVALVPRDLWANKPDGFGTVLTRELRPELLRESHSMAALNHGEWIYALGIVGAVLMIPAIGLFILAIDRHWTKVASVPVTNLAQVLRLSAAAVLCAGTADLFWVGSFMYSARSGARVVCLGIGIAFLRLAQGTKTPSSLPKPPQPGQYTGGSHRSRAVL